MDLGFAVNKLLLHSKTIIICIPNGQFHLPYYRLGNESLVCLFPSYISSLMNISLTPFIVFSVLGSNFGQLISSIPSGHLQCTERHGCNCGFIYSKGWFINSWVCLLEFVQCFPPDPLSYSNQHKKYNRLPVVLLLTVSISSVSNLRVTEPSKPWSKKPKNWFKFYTTWGRSI